jgi:3-oxoacyl-[acyl-carrier protein] reductase
MVVSEGKTMQNQVVVVTGASGGIGSAICERYANEGAHVVVTYNANPEKAQALERRLAGSGHLVAQAQVDQSDSLRKLAAQVAEQYSKVNVLVNCAGVTRQVQHADLDGLDDELIDRIFRINWRGAFSSVRAFKDLLAKDPGGTIINISSIAGTTGVGSNVAYCASKAALDSMTRSLARALAPKIRVFSVAPGWVEGEYAQRMDPEMLATQKRLTPLQRIAQAEDVAKAVLAATTMLTFSTGNIIHVDGGRPLGI